MRYSIGLAAAVCVALGMGIAAPAARADAKADCDQSQDLDLRIRGCSEVIARRDGFTPHAHYTRGKAYLAKGEHDRAMAGFSEAIKHVAHHFNALKYRAKAYASQGRP